MVKSVSGFIKTTSEQFEQLTAENDKLRNLLRQAMLEILWKSTLMNQDGESNVMVMAIREVLNEADSDKDTSVLGRDDDQ